VAENAGADHRTLPESARLARDINAYMKRVGDAFVTDAYHSLSIEGYRVTTELIERIRSGTWNPEADEEDREQTNAMAARGYWQAYQAVQRSIGRVLRGENPGLIADEDHGTWYREMFTPSVTAGLLKPANLAGYRTGQVYIRRSMHVPLNRDAVRDAMPALFDLLREEKDPAVRAVLGHFVFVYIHPYMDGNGRMGRFLLNLMLASGGYPWTVVPWEIARFIWKLSKAPALARTFFRLRISWLASSRRDWPGNRCRRCRSPHRRSRPAGTACSSVAPRSSTGSGSVYTYWETALIPPHTLQSRRIGDNHSRHFPRIGPRK
jgi:hypothetical protein